MNSDGFVTQLEGGLPRLLVISLQSELVWLHPIVEVAATSGLQGEVASLDQSSDKKFEEAYKVVFVVPILDVHILRDYISENAEKLRLVPRVVIVLYGAQWQILSQGDSWEDAKQALHELLPHVAAIVVVDCLEVGGATPLLEQWRRPLVSPSDEIVVEDASYGLYPLSFETFVSRLQELLVRPLTSGWFQVRGEAVASSVVLQALCAGVASLGTQPPRIDISPTPPPDPSSLGTVLIEGESNTASKGIQAAVMSAVTTFVNSLERIPEATHKSNAKPLPRPTLAEKKAEPKPQPPKTHAAPLPYPEPPPNQEITGAIVHQVSESTRTPVSTPPQPPVKETSTSKETEAHLDKAVTSLFAQERSEEKNTHIKNTTKQTKAVVHKLKRRKRVYWGGLVLLGISLAVLSIGSIFAGTYWIVGQGLDKTVLQLSESGIVSASNAPENKNTFINDALSWQASTLNAVFSLEVFDDAQRLASLATLTSTVPTELTAWQNSLATWVAQSLSGETAPSLEDLTLLNTQEEQLYADISGISAGLKTVSAEELPADKAEIQQKFDVALAKTRKQLAAFQQISPLLPEVLGYQAPRTYAVIFQNPQELRPTGGFLQSVALLTFDKGLLIDTQVISSYDLDKNLLGAVTPPTDLQRFLGEQRWFLRDANWSPDYPTSASHISWFIEQTARKPVSGVIAIDAYTWQAVIKALGPIEVPEYNEVITDKNVLERLEFHSELIFDQGQPKTEYSTLLFTKILNKLKSATPQQMNAVLQGLSEKAVSGNMLVWLKQNAEASVMANLGLDGALLSPSCPDQLLADNCLVETVAQVEANVGVNKANAHLDKTTVHSVVMQPAQVLHTRTTTYKNNASSTAWPKGPYKAYVRWYLSPNALNPTVSVGQTQVPQDQLFFSEEKGKKIVGTFVEVPVQGTVQVSLKYSSALPYQGQFSYAFFSQRQPGLEKNSETVTVSHDPLLKPKIIIPQATISGNNITFANTVTEGHTYVGIAFE